MQQLLSNLEDERQRQFRRFVAISAALHLALGFVAWWSPFRPSGTALPAVVRVDLVSVSDLAPAPKPVKAAPARPPPPPPPPPEVKKVLPKQPAPLPKPKAEKPKPKAAEPKPEAKPKEEPKPPEPAPVEQDYDDVLAQLRDEAGEKAPTPVEQAAVAPAAGPAGLGQVVSPEVARWMRDVKMQVTRAWILEPGFRLQPLETLIEVELGPTGEVLGTRITRGSGNPWYDESVERAIRKASPLPAPPDPGEWPFSFKPSDRI